MRAYCREGEKRALALPNRGPLRFTETGDLHPEIIEAWSEYGFYVLEGVIETKELDDIERDLMHILDRLPVEKGSPVDASGRPALGAGCKSSATTSTLLSTRTAERLISPGFELASSAKLRGRRVP